jgi:hypothetical protein
LSSARGTLHFSQAVRNKPADHLFGDGPLHEKGIHLPVWQLGSFQQGVHMVPDIPFLTFYASVFKKRMVVEIYSIWTAFQSCDILKTGGKQIFVSRDDSTSRIGYLLALYLKE